MSKKNSPQIIKTAEKIQISIQLNLTTRNLQTTIETTLKLTLLHLNLLTEKIEEKNCYKKPLAHRNLLHHNFWLS